MNRQELFHGDFHLMSVSRAEQGYRGASMIFPFPFVTIMKNVVPPDYANRKQESDLNEFNSLLIVRRAAIKTL